MIIEQHEYLEEEGTKELIALTKAALNTKLNSNDANISNGTITIKSQSITPVTEQYTLPNASDTTLGGIKVGDNLTIDSETGVLSADDQSITVDDELDDTSENPVQNKVIKVALDDKLDKTEATIASGVVTIQEHQLVPITPSEVETMWGSIVPPQPAPSGINVGGMRYPSNNSLVSDIASIGSQTIIES